MHLFTSTCISNLSWGLLDDRQLTFFFERSKLEMEPDKIPLDIPQVARGVINNPVGSGDSSNDVFSSGPHQVETDVAKRPE